MQHIIISKVNNCYCHFFIDKTVYYVFFLFHQSYQIYLLRKLVEAKVGSNLDDYMLQLQKTPLEEARHGKTLTLRDYGIKNGNTLFLLKVGIVLNINNPEVGAVYTLS